MEAAKLVFISQSSEDGAIGSEVCHLLEAQGIGCWIAPRDIMPGQDYGEQIIESIRSTRVMVLILSGNANNSTFVKNEVERAINYGKVVIPLRVENVQPSKALELFVSRSQWVDAWAPPLDSRVAVLASAIRGLLGLPPLGEATSSDAIAPTAPAGAPLPATHLAPRAAAPRTLTVGGVVLPSWAPAAGAIVLAATLLIGGLAILSRSGGSPATPTPTRAAFVQPSEQAQFSMPPMPGQQTERPTGSAIALPSVAISGSNAGQVAELGLWDKAGANDVFWSSDGKTLAANTGRGVTMLDPSTMADTSSIQMGGSTMMATSADWKVVAIADYDGVALWSMEGAQLTDKFAGSKETSRIAISPDGKYVATQTGTSVKLWDAGTGKQIKTLIAGDNPFGTAVAFSPDGKILAGTSGSDVKEWDTSTWSPMSTASCLYEPSWIVFSPDSKVMAVAGTGDGGAGVIRLCDASTGRQLRSLSFNAQRVAFSPDGSLLVASSSREPTIKLWSVATGEEVATLTGHSSNPVGVGFSPDGKLLASAASDGVRLWGVKAASAAPSAGSSPIAAISVPSIPISSGAISPANAAALKQAALWDKARAYMLSYSPDGTMLAVATDNDLEVLDAQSMAVQRQLPVGGGYGVLAFARDWSMVAVDGNDGVVLWDMNGAQLKTLAGSHDTRCAAFSPDDRLLATCTGSAVKVWDVASGTAVKTLTGDMMSYGAVAFAPDGKTLLTGGEAVTFWDTGTWKQLRQTKGMGSIRTLAISPDGSLVAAGDAFNGVTIYAVATGLQQRVFSGQQIVVSLAFSPDGKLIASAAWDNSVKVFDVAGGKTAKSIADHSDRAEAVAFSPDGSTLATGSLDSTVRLWRVGP